MKIKNIGKNARKKMVALNCIVIFVFLVLYYIVVGCPAFSAADRFRREELAYGIGPAEILAHISMDDYPIYRERPDLEPDMRVILASSKYGATVYRYREDTKRDYGFLQYWEKKDGVVLCTVPGMMSYYDANELDSPIKVPIILFDNAAGAVRAKLEITLRSFQYSWEYAYEEQYTVFANRDGEGYFLFTVEPYKETDNYRFYRAIEDICDRNADAYYYSDGKYHYDPSTYTVYFYDQDGNLTSTYSGEVQSIVAEAHEEKSK